MKSSTTSLNRTGLKFGDSCVICAASVTVEDCRSATLALTLLRMPTHVHGKNMHARTHGRARAHARTRERRYLHARTHSAHTQHSHPHMRTAGEHLYSTLDVRKPATLTALIYHNLPSTTGLHRHLSGCPSRHALADRALAPCHTKGSRNARVREPAQQRAPRLHLLSRVGRQLCAGLHRRLSGCPSRHAFKLADHALACQ